MSQRRRSGMVGGEPALSGAVPRAEHATVADGARGVRFIERTVASAASDAKWTAV